MRPTTANPHVRRAALHSSPRGLTHAFRRCVAVLATVAVSQGVVTATPAVAEPQTPEPPTAAAAPSGTVAGAAGAVAQTPTSPPVPTARMESWTPSSHSVTVDGQTTLDLFAHPAFKRNSDGWSPIDATITAGSGYYPFEALELANPVHFGLTADALVTIDTVSGPVMFGLEGATVNTPTLTDGVITYPGVFPGVDLEFRTDGGRIGKHVVLADEHAASAFRFIITDPGHTLGDPTEGAGESWTFSSAVAYATGIELPAPAAWAQADGRSGAPGSAHQQVSVTDDGYAIDLSVDASWAATASYPLVLDPAIEWTDEAWEEKGDAEDDRLSIAFAPAGATDCEGGPCSLADPVDGKVTVGPVQDPITDEGEPATYTNFLAYVGADVSVLADRQVASAVLYGWQYEPGPIVRSLCSTLAPGSTGADLAAARCGSPYGLESFPTEEGVGWKADVTDTVRRRGDGQRPHGIARGLLH